MKLFDPGQHPELRNLFPELTPVQFETAFLFSFGCSQKEISVLRSVNYRLVQREIAGAKSKFETKSLTQLLTIFHIRLMLFALYGALLNKSELVTTAPLADRLLCDPDAVRHS